MKELSHRRNTTVCRRVSMTWGQDSTGIVSPDRPFDVAVSDEYRKFLWFDTELSVSCHMTQLHCIRARIRAGFRRGKKARAWL